MSIFEPNSTPEIESPQGHEEIEAEQFENQVEFADESAEQEEQQEPLDDEGETDPEDGYSEQLFAGKYKNPAELEKAYIELQRQFTRQRMEQKAATTQPTKQEPIQQQDQIDLNDPNAIIDAINRDPAGTIAKIAQMTYQQVRTVETQEQAFQRGMDEVVDTYKERLQSDEDYGQYFEKIADICRDLGVNPRNPSPRVLKMAAQELWGDPRAQSMQQAYNQAKQAARTESEAVRRMKQGLSAPKGAKPKDMPKTAEEIYAESIIGSGTRKGLFG